MNPLILVRCFTACVDAFVYHAANFGFYNLLGGLWTRHVGRAFAPSNPLVGLLLGMTAGAAAQFLCCPFTTLTLRMAAAHERFAPALTTILKADGVGGLWRGMRAGLLMTPRPAISFLVVENVTQPPALIRHHAVHRHPGCMLFSIGILDSPRDWSSLPRS